MARDEDGTVIPIVEERVSVGKREVRTGTVSVITGVEEREERIPVDLSHAEVEIERVPIGREVETAPQPREEDGVLVVPVVEEVPVVVKRLMLKEEIRITRRIRHETESIPVTLKSMRAVVERSRPDQDEGDRQ